MFTITFRNASHVYSQIHMIVSYAIERFVVYMMFAHLMYDLYDRVLKPAAKTLAPYQYTILVYIDLIVTIIKTYVMFAFMTQIMRDMEASRNRSKKLSSAQTSVSENKVVQDPNAFQNTENPIVY